MEIFSSNTDIRVHYYTAPQFKYMRGAGGLPFEKTLLRNE